MGVRGLIADRGGNVGECRLPRRSCVSGSRLPVDVARLES
ncbi:hypothetical protein C7S13_4202 [Burkholderia cepacia]|nr:hypothetical protein [Burkholderia cepacia]